METLNVWREIQSQAQASRVFYYVLKIFNKRDLFTRDKIRKEKESLKFLEVWTSHA